MQLASGTVVGLAMNAATILAVHASPDRNCTCPPYGNSDEKLFGDASGNYKDTYLKTIVLPSAGSSMSRLPLLKFQDVASLRSCTNWPA